MIEWMRRADPERPFLTADGRTWSYGDALVAVERRISAVPRLCFPTLAHPTSILDVVAAMAGGGATVVSRVPETDHAVAADLVVYTSGTSGAPKGVHLTRVNLTAAASASAEHLGHDADDTWLLAMPPHHVGGLSIIVRQMWTGGAVTVLPRFEPESFAAAMHGEVTMVSVVPTMLRRLVALGPFDGLRAVLVGGGPIPEGLLEEAAAAGLPALPTYGMTETFGQVATLRPGSPPERKAHPLPGIALRIEGDGRVAIKGDQVSTGYVGEPDRDDPWLVTNDIGEIDDDGAIRIRGRADTMIITGGENVSPEQVEAVLKEHPGVEEIVVLGVPDEEWGSRVEAVYVGSAGQSELEECVSERLPGYMVPKRFTRVDKIPHTSIGKPDRVAVAELGLGRGDGWA